MYSRHSGDGVLAAELACNDAREHIQFVLARDRDEQVAVSDVCLALDRHCRSVSAQRHNIERVGKQLYFLLVLFNNGYIVVFVCQLKSK